MLLLLLLLLTPSLPKPVKCLGWKMHRCACRQYILWSCNTSTFSAVCFDENPFTCQCEKENKQVEGFHILHLYARFQVTPWQRRGQSLVNWKVDNREESSKCLLIYAFISHEESGFVLCLCFGLKIKAVSEWRFAYDYDGSSFWRHFVVYVVMFMLFSMKKKCGKLKQQRLFL